MNSYREERAITIAHYIVETGETNREVAKKFGLGKSTIHREMTKILPYINSTLAEQVQEVFKANFSDKHYRGGAATKAKCKKFKGGK